MKIDIAHQLVHLRHRAVNEPSPMNPPQERLTWRLWAWAMGGPRRYRLAMWAVRQGIRMAPWLPWHPGKLGAWTRGRALPKVPGPAFRNWWRRKEKFIHNTTTTRSAMSSREAILQRIRTTWPGIRRWRPRPWPRSGRARSRNPGVLAERFAKEVEAVFGEPIRCHSMAEAQQQLAGLMESAPLADHWGIGWPAGARSGRRAAAGARPVGGARWTPAADRRASGRAGAADVLLADTGSCMIACGTTHERLMCYLPPACVVVGRVAQLAEHLPAAWTAIAGRCRRAPCGANSSW